MTSDKIKCPCCGQATPVNTEVRVNLTWNALYFRDIEVGLTPQEAELVSVLANRMPEVVSSDHLISSLWGFTETETAANRIKVIINHLRRKLLKAGLGITNHRERGYSLVVLPQLLKTERSTHGSHHATA